MNNNNNQQRTIFHSNKRLSDYLFDLPYPYNIEAYANYREQATFEYDNTDPLTSKPVEKLSRALILAFKWQISKEGPEYWKNLHNWLQQLEEI